MADSHIAGAGIDLVENEQMTRTLKRWGKKFKDKVFLKREQDYCDRKASPECHYAARFAVKEAVSKAFGTGVGPHIGWLDIEVRRNSHTGAPSVDLLGKAKTLSKKRGITDILVSLSHTSHYSVAQAILVSNCSKRTTRNKK